MKKYKTPVYVYLMKAGNLYKIGQSCNPEKRLKTIKIGNPGVKLICYGRNYNEKQMHKMFKRYRVSGEWFELPQNAVTWIEYNIGDKEHVLQKKERKENYELLNSGYEDFVINFGKYKGTKLINMKNEEELRYCRYIFESYKGEDTYAKRAIKWWYLYYTDRKESDLKYSTSDLNKHNN